MAKILIVGNPSSPLVQNRGVVGQKAGHQIVWFTHERGIEIPDVTFHHPPKFVQQSFVARAFLEPIYLKRVITETQPDLIHVHYASKGLAAIPLSNFHPLVVSSMGSDILPEVGYRGMYAPLIKLLLDQADCITTKSDFMDSALDKIGSYRPKIRRVTWGIDLDLFHPNRDVTYLRDELEIAKDEFVFFDPRTARPLYNKPVILSAFAKLLDSVDSAVLIVSEMSGSQEYLQQLHNQADTLGIIQKVRFVGRITYNQMADYYNLANVTLSVPSSDGLPQTIYEAFACDSFLISGDLPQYRGIVKDQVNARTVAVGNIEELAEAMVWVYDNKDICSQIIVQNRAYVKAHADCVQQTNYVNAIYNHLLSGNFEARQ